MIGISLDKDGETSIKYFIIIIFIIKIKLFLIKFNYTILLKCLKNF